MTLPDSVVQAVAAARPYGPGLDYLIQVVAAGGGAVGALIGLILPTRSRTPAYEMWKNAGIGLTVGGVIGTVVAFSIWVALRLNGGVG